MDTCCFTQKLQQPPRVPVLRFLRFKLWLPSVRSHTIFICSMRCCEVEDQFRPRVMWEMENARLVNYGAQEIICQERVHSATGFCAEQETITARVKTTKDAQWNFPMFFLYSWLVNADRVRRSVSGTHSPVRQNHMVHHLKFMCLLLRIVFTNETNTFWCCRKKRFQRAGEFRKHTITSNILNNIE